MANATRPEKRNVYTDKDGLKMEGYRITEVLEDRLEILAKREYVWGEYGGLAIKAKPDGGDTIVVESISKVVNIQFTHSKCPKPPFFGHFESKLSKTKRKYFTFVFDPT